MRLGLVALVVTIFGGAYLIAGRAPEDRVLTKPRPKREAALDRKPQSHAVKAVRHKQVRSAMPRFVGEHFSIRYPKGWKVETAEASTGAYLDTTIRHPTDSSTYLRVDVTPGRGADPAAHAEEVEGYLLRQDTYRRIGLAPARLSGFPAMRWDFDVVESGIRLRKVDVFLTDGNRNRIAVLTQSPDAVFERYAPLFARLRASLVPRQQGLEQARIERT
jgi:hypothetical protein